jgi:hypothetical protein
MARSEADGRGRPLRPPGSVLTHQSPHAISNRLWCVRVFEAARKLSFPVQEIQVSRMIDVIARRRIRALDLISGPVFMNDRVNLFPGSREPDRIYTEVLQVIFRPQSSRYTHTLSPKHTTAYCSRITVCSEARRDCCERQAAAAVAVTAAVVLGQPGLNIGNV